MTKLEVIKYNMTLDEETNIEYPDPSSVDVNWIGLANSFLLSVGNDTVF